MKRKVTIFICLLRIILNFLLLILFFIDIITITIIIQFFLLFPLLIALHIVTYSAFDPFLLTSSHSPFITVAFTTKTRDTHELSSPHRGGEGTKRRGELRGKTAVDWGGKGGQGRRGRRQGGRAGVHTSE